MSRFGWPILVGACASLAGVLLDIPIVVALGALLACGLMLLALVSYFAALP